MMALLLRSVDTVPPNLILGSYLTPVLHWVAAQRAFPDALSICYEGDETGIWRDLNTSDAWGELTLEQPMTDAPQAEAVTSKPTDEPSKPLTDLVTEAPKPVINNVQSTAKPNQEKPTTRSIRDYSDAELLHELFIKSTWQDQMTIDRLMQEVRNRHARNPQLIAQAEENQKHAMIAIALGNQAVNRFKKQLAQDPTADTVDVMKWLSKQPFAHIASIKRHAKIQLNKYAQFQIAQKEKHNASKKQPKQAQQPSALQPITFKDHHPNSLRHLKPSQQWTVVIDETGKVEVDAVSFAYQNKNLGRVVALAIPQYAEKMLPPLSGHHATTATDTNNDLVVASILKSEVGVFGFTIQDSGLEVKQVWFDAISRLVNWVMLMLPMDNGVTTYVRFLIEQHGGHTESYAIDIVAEEVMSRLKSIDSERFAQTQVEARFIAKNGSAFNGYVDTIAHAWGSQHPVTKARLKKTAWEDHCLLRPNQQAVERIYLAATAKRHLSPEQWYEACTIVVNEPSSSLLHGFMAEIGQNVQKDKKLWHDYMSHINNRLRTKAFRNTDLAQSLAWLQTYLPDNQHLSSMAELQWRSAKLAQNNHQGSVETQEFVKVFTLANKLRNESAVESAQAILRVITATTNAFEFESALPALQQWLNEDIAVVGLLNHAKLHSSLGQLCAFRHDPAQAIVQYDQAIHYFEQMSDVASVSRDIAQTNTYKLIAMMDNHTPAEQLLPQLWQALQSYGKNSQEVVQLLAVSDDEDKSAVFHHHLLLRAMVTYPQIMQDEINAYLAQEQAWQVYDDAHPWQWISAYRGWLLAMQGDLGKAQHYMIQAIDICTGEEQGATMHWIGSVISMMTLKLGIKLDNQIALSKDYLETLQAALPNAPFTQLQTWHEDKTATTQQHIVRALQLCTPFNFH
jgi:tetratricopeptide (TPR) repeat protein